MVEQAGAGTPAPTIRTVREALALAWRAIPVALTVYAVVVVLFAVVPVGVAWLTKLMIDRLSDGETERGALLSLAAALVGAGLAASLLPHVANYLRDVVERAVGLHAHDRLYIGVERFNGLGRFENPEFQDRLRLAQQAAGVTSSQLIGTIIELAGSAVTVVAFVSSLVVVSRWMVGAILLAVLPVLVAELKMARRRASMMWGLGPIERRELFYSSLLSSVEAAKEVRLFGIGRFLRRRMVAERRVANEARRRLDRRELGIQSLLGTLSGAVAGAGLIWAVVEVYESRLTIGDLSMFVAAVGGVQASLISMITRGARAHQQLILFGHYCAVVDAGPDLPTADHPVVPRPLRHGVELRDVWFRYSDDHPWVLRGVSLFIPHGTAFALVGRNGAGKSTLIKLLCRLYDPTHGAIYWDGVDVRAFGLRQFRERIGALFQDFMHYDLSAAENIALGSIEALGDQPRIERAARLAGIHDHLAALPRGYDTLLTRLFRNPNEPDDATSGVLLSGGQWQRVALARALLRVRRDLLILDEPSAGLDAVAEHEVHATIREHRFGATSVLISHRMGALREADVIAVLVDGRITEIGSHDELLGVDGEYATLFRMQAQGYAGAASSRSRAFVGELTQE